MKDYQFFGAYANIPLDKRNDLISTEHTGNYTWHDLYMLLKDGLWLGISLLRTVNKYELWRIMPTLSDLSKLI